MFFTGRSGSIIFNGYPVAKVRDWSLETTVELLPTTTLGDFASTFTPGIKGATGSATLVYYRLEPGEVGNRTEFTALLSKVQKLGAITENERVLLELNVGGDARDDVRFNAYITSATVSASTGELSVVPIQFTVDGDFELGGIVS